MDPTNLRGLPGSEYRKRVDYWRAWRKAMGQAHSSGSETIELAPGVEVEKQTWSDLDKNATIVE